MYKTFKLWAGSSFLVGHNEDRTDSYGAPVKCMNTIVKIKSPQKPHGVVGETTVKL